MDKDKEKLFELYLREREYQRLMFGDYKNDKSLTFSSFIVFLQEYMKSLSFEYTKNWKRILPTWLKSCKEFENHRVAPVTAYEELIKIFALAGAALETYTDIAPEEWRKKELGEENGKEKERE